MHGHMNVKFIFWSLYYPQNRGSILLGNNGAHIRD